ncbi:hypothetical protein [Herbiconiux sp.]|uniref:hypothetical protein n=1 Tax=Herbiconiux sp. TaxID=1871186 RepID=UPI0025BA2D7B|nr:hypothetical protein [Herbiconiux sp.]
MAARATTTPTTPAAETAPLPEPNEVVYDFDGWTPEAETKAIAALAPEIPYIIVEKNFVGRFPDGIIVKMPLSISLDEVDALSSGDPVDQFKALLTTLAGEEAAKQFSRHDLAETVVMSSKFFAVFERIAKASLPE